MARDRILWIALAVLVFAMAYGFVRGNRRIAERNSAQRLFLQHAREVVTRNQRLAFAIERRIASGAEPERIPPPFGSRHPVYVAAWCRQPAVLPPSPLSWVAIGQSYLYPTGYAGPEFDEVSQIANPMKLLAGEWDISFTVVYLLPLLIIALSFDLVASDRESGIMQLALSQPVRARTILLAKASTVGAAVVGTVVLVYVLGVVATGVSLRHGMLIRATIGLFAVLAYALFWLAVAAGLNSHHRSAAQNAFTLTALWLLFVVLIPFAIDQIATNVHPVPPHAEIVNVARSAPETVKRIGRDQVIASFLKHHPELPSTKGISDLGLLYLEGAARREAVQQINQATQQRWEASLRQQQGLANRLSLLSPAALLTGTLIELAGTSRSRYLDFLDQTSEYRARYDKFFLLREMTLPSSLFNTADYDLIPTMTYREEPSAHVIRRALVFLFGLLFIAVLVASVAIRPSGASD
jgi:ABC-2 type transport system permease protein